MPEAPFLPVEHLRLREVLLLQPTSFCGAAGGGASVAGSRGEPRAGEEGAAGAAAAMAETEVCARALERAGLPELVPLLGANVGWRHFSAAETVRVGGVEHWVVWEGGGVSSWD